MKKIFGIMKRDATAVFTNVVALVIVIGLSIIPSLYAWFNINSNWDPYGEDSTGNLVIAVYSADEGSKIGGLSVNIGNSVVEALEGNRMIGWVFPEDERLALNGVYSGEYYAALVIPENFTADVLGVVDGSFTGGTMYYYENEKKNAIATKITGKVKTAVENQINSTVLSTITEMIAKAGKASDITGSSLIYSTAIQRLNNMKEKVDGFINTVNVGKKTLKAADSTISGFSGLNAKIVDDLRTDLSLIPGLSTELSVSGLNLANMRLRDYSDLIKNAGDDLGEVKKRLKSLSRYLDEMTEKARELESSDKAAKFAEILQNDSERIAVFFSTPVDIETEVIYPVKNFGSQMAPFYTVLAIWFGSLILVAIIHIDVKPFGDIEKLNIAQKFFGRYMIFFVIGQVQTVICVLGDLFFCEIQCEYAFLFWAISAMSSFAFTMLIYSLTFAFGNVGEALAVIVMVIQVAGAGGTFPKEVLPEAYRVVYSFMPFTYAMDGMKEAVAGLYGNVFVMCILKLLAVIVVSIIIGFVGRIIFSPMNHLMEEAKEKTGIMV